MKDQKKQTNRIKMRDVYKRIRQEWEINPKTRVVPKKTLAPQIDDDDLTPYTVCLNCRGTGGTEVGVCTVCWGLGEHPC